jgi:small conductance mechanosensitive channel
MQFTKLLKPYKKYIDLAKTRALEYLPRGVISIVSLLFFYILARVVFNQIVNAEVSKDKVANGKILFKTIGDITFYGILTLGIVFTLVNLGLEINTVFVVLGSVGLAIALALQDTISNVSSGVMILLLDYYDIGDFVEIDKNIGVVEKFDLLTTTIKNPNGIMVKIPNNMITKGVLINYQKNEDVFYSFDMNMSNNEKHNLDDFINITKEEIKNNLQYVSDKEKIKVFISDTSAEGTKITIKIPVKSKDLIPLKQIAIQFVRKIAIDNKLNLLDHAYISKKGDEGGNPKGN